MGSILANAPNRHHPDHPGVLNLIVRIDEFKGAWRALGTLVLDRLSALRRIATIESIGSSTRIEGSRLSDREVEQFLSNLEIKTFATRDEQVRRLEIKIEREKQILASLPTRSLQAIEFAREHGRVTMGEAPRLTGASRNMLKQHFRALVERGYLNQHGRGRGVWYDLRWAEGRTRVHG